MWTPSLFQLPHPSPYFALSEPSFLKRCVHLHLLFPSTHSSSYPVQFLYPALPTGLDDKVASDFPVDELRVQCLVLTLLDLSKAFHWAVLFLFLKPFLFWISRGYTPRLSTSPSACTSYFPTGDLSPHRRIVLILLPIHGLGTSPTAQCCLKVPSFLLSSLPKPFF